MSSRQVFTSRLRNRPLLDSEGLTVGRVRDVVILPWAGQDPPRALGLVVTLQRRRIFVNLGQITEISVDGAHLRGGAVELDRFTRRTGEILASELNGRSTPGGTVADVAIVPVEHRRGRSGGPPLARPPPPGPRTPAPRARPAGPGAPPRRRGRPWCPPSGSSSGRTSRSPGCWPGSGARICRSPGPCRRTCAGRR